MRAALYTSGELGYNSDMAARAPRPSRLSKEEWLELEQQTDQRYEYLDGFVYAMAGESQLHNEIVGNITEALRARARARGCHFAFLSVRVAIAQLNRYYYPDVVVSCAEEPHSHEIHQPCLVVEVLSKSSAERDRREKLDAYFKIPTLQTYLLVSQEERRVEVYQKAPWNLLWSEWINEGAIEIPCLGETLSLSQIYAGLEVPEV
jgi:Uma2 family endonuclease